MAIVSISEASRLTGKTRATIHRHINAGKVSKSKDDSGNTGIDVSELVRVYNIKIDTPYADTKTVKIEQDNTGELNTLKTRLAVLEAENYQLKDHVESLKNAMNLLEHKKEETEVRRGFFSRLFRQ